MFWFGYLLSVQLGLLIFTKCLSYLTRAARSALLPLFLNLGQTFRDFITSSFDCFQQAGAASSSACSPQTQRKQTFSFSLNWFDRKLQFPLQQISHKRTVSPIKPTLCHPLSVCCVSSEVKFRFHFHLMETCTHQTLY